MRSKIFYVSQGSRWLPTLIKVIITLRSCAQYSHYLVFDLILLMSLRFKLSLHFKSYIVFQFLTVLPDTWPIYVPANVNFWHLALGEYSFWTHLHSSRRLQCLHEDAKVTWVCCTCPPALIGADLAWFAQSFCPVTIGCCPNQLTITAVLLVVFPPVNVILTSVKWGKTSLRKLKKITRLLSNEKLKNVFIQQLLY